MVHTGLEQLSAMAMVQLLSYGRAGKT